jgi:hypothetical protein
MFDRLLANAWHKTDVWSQNPDCGGGYNSPSTRPVHSMNTSLSRIMLSVAVVHSSLAMSVETRASDSMTKVAQQEIVRAGSQSSVAGSDEYFVGQVRVQPVWPADASINASGGLVTFEAGVRSA